MNLGGQVNKVVDYTWQFSGASTMTARLNALKNVAVGASAAIVAGMSAVTVASVRTAGEFMELENQFNVVFGDSAVRAREELDAFAESIGRSGNRMVGYAAAIQDTFVPLGLARSEAADLSVAAVQLATDLSSFKNLDMDQTVDRITSALAGQHRAVQQLGIVINQTNLDQELMNMGISGGVQAATEAEKAIARYNIIVRSSSDAIGDAERTSGEWTNQLRSLEDQWYDVKVVVGEAVIPILQDLIPYVQTVIADFGVMAADAIPQVIQAVAAVLPTLASMATAVIRLTGTVADFIDVASGGSGSAGMEAVRSISGSIDMLTQATVDGSISAAEYQNQINALMSDMSGLRLHDEQMAMIEAQVFASRDIVDIYQLQGADAAQAALAGASGVVASSGTIPDIIMGGGGGGGGTGGKPDAHNNMKKLLDDTKTFTGEVLRAYEEKHTVIISAMREEEMSAQRIQGIFDNAAARFGRALKGDMQDVLGIAIQIGAQLAAAKLGGPAGTVFGFLGGLI